MWCPPWLPQRHLAVALPRCDSLRAARRPGRCPPPQATVTPSAPPSHRPKRRPQRRAAAAVRAAREKPDRHSHRRQAVAQCAAWPPPSVPAMERRSTAGVCGDSPIKSGLRVSASPSASWSSSIHNTLPDCRSLLDSPHPARPLRVRIVLPQAAVAGSISNTSQRMPQPA